ncbi:MAG: acyltransferase family protein [Deltaproteobacteria bacterium]|nr:acyltransferase family protein [Deltaproteobacteria bacterium]
MGVPLTFRLMEKRYLTPELRAHLEGLEIADTGHGFDSFGLNEEWIRAGAGVFAPLYDSWFRVDSTGIEHVPTEGGAVLAANHAGTIPIDGMMIWNDVLRKTTPPRVVRTVMDHFVNLLPAISIIFGRCGAVGGSRGNFHELLERGELISVFPEGLPAIGKPWSDRYTLCDWRQGHAEMAIRHGVPIVPIGVIGSEEQLPTLMRLPIHLFGLPYLPIPASPVPLPTKYHIYYGEPIPVHEDYRRDQADDADVVREASERVKAAVAGLLQRGLSERTGVFR